MERPIQITFRDVPRSDAVESAIRNEAAELEKYFDRITGCRVVVSEPHQRHRKGKLYAVQVSLAVPGEELVVSHEHGLHPGHEDVYLAVREAFHATRRKLEDYVRVRRHKVKSPATAQRVT